MTASTATDWLLRAPHGSGRAGGGGPPPSLPDTQPLLEAVLEQLPLAVLALDASLRLLYANASGRRLLERSDGISANGGCIEFPFARHAELAVRRAIAGAGAGDGRPEGQMAAAFHLERPSCLRPFELWLRPVEGAALGDGLSEQPRIGLLFVRDPDEGVPLESQSLRLRHGLTDAESRTALAVLMSDGLLEASHKLDVRPMTVRGYLRQVFDKTRAHSQLDLARLLLVGATRFELRTQLLRRRRNGEGDS